MLHDESTNQTSRHTANNARNERHPSLRRTFMLHRLYIHRHMENEGHTTRNTEKVAQVARQQGRIRHDPLGRERLRGESELYDGKDDKEHGERGEGDDGGAICPGNVPAVIEADEERSNTEDKSESTAEVNAFQLVEPVRVITGGELES